MPRLQFPADVRTPQLRVSARSFCLRVTGSPCVFSARHRQHNCSSWSMRHLADARTRLGRTTLSLSRSTNRASAPCSTPRASLCATGMPSIRPAGSSRQWRGRFLTTCWGGRMRRRLLRVKRTSGTDEPQIPGWALKPVARHDVPCTHGGCHRDQIHGICTCLCARARIVQYS